jgi:hypothetical protein
MPKQSKTSVIFKKYGAAETSLPTGLYGSGAAVSFVREQSQSGLDIAIVGDSNTGFNAPTAGGYVWGLSYGLNTNKPDTCYGTPVYPLMASGNTPGFKSSFSGASVVSTSGDGYSSGKASATVITPFFDRGSGVWSMTGGANEETYIDYPYLASGNQTGTLNRGVTVESDHPMGISNELRYRVLRGQFSGGGSHRYRVRLSGSTPLTTTNAISANGATALVADEVVVAAGARSTAIEGFWSVQANAGILNTGPISPILQSMYTPRVGWAVGAMYFYGGHTLTNVADNIDLATDGTVKTYLNELYNRQVAAGGTGRVLVWLQGGINQGDWTAKPGLWLTQWGQVIQRCRSAWSALGLDASKLTFAVMCTHDSTGYNFATRREDLKNFAKTQKDVTVVNIPEIIQYSSYSAQESGAHLTKTGYELVGNAIIQRMLGVA